MEDVFLLIRPQVVCLWAGLICDIHSKLRSKTSKLIKKKGSF